MYDHFSGPVLPLWGIWKRVCLQYHKKESIRLEITNFWQFFLALVLNLRKNPKKLKKGAFLRSKKWAFFMKDGQFLNGTLDLLGITEIKRQIIRTKYYRFSNNLVFSLAANTKKP